ncbi:hypothetical protein BUALT_Bualt04G0049900 [Buddleja alternifolia]|uniref:WD repeat-containing protein 44 n=1 Tax=Buddleja alternifolia TaxID=168488 RepID=A0AAV6XLG5_9LAMI|nr:hypothetical protein BUALT_Bualt04G0049900 [Buddleja alternifolia]
MMYGDEVEEIFFDTEDRFISEEPIVVKRDLMCSNSEYDIWLREPQSVKERRDCFLSTMGFVECSTLIESETVALQGITVSSSCGSSTPSIDDNLLSERRRSNSEANCSVDYSYHDWLDYISITDIEGGMNENLVSDKQFEIKQVEACLGKNRRLNKKMMQWWRNLTQKMKSANFPKEPKLFGEEGKTGRMRIEQNRKRCMECSAVYGGQQLKAHNGLIWTMKFSPDGQYLASGGEDGLVCIWRVGAINKADNCNFESPQIKKSSNASVVIPEKIFHIEEAPRRKFQGHSSDVLDLAWSTSNQLLSSSMDKTVRLWQVGSDKCLGAFQHNNYVTCVQFDPVDENYFISGSIDGKVRIWGITKRRVEDWANVTDIVTAVCYQPNGKGFVVGSVSGTCRFYELSGDELLLNAEINIQGRKKSSGNKITGIQFLKSDSQRVMITSEDSKIRILDGLEVVRKYKGLTNSGSQMWASFTPSGSHIVSVGEDSHIYLWNYDELSIQTSKQPKSIRSCEYFLSEGASVVLTWSDFDTEPKSCVFEASSGSERFSLANWFSMEGSSKASITWPEEKLPLWDEHKNENHGSPTWGLVFVTANMDGTIRTFHNYGLPLRV